MIRSCQERINIGVDAISAKESDVGSGSLFCIRTCRTGYLPRPTTSFIWGKYLFYSLRLPGKDCIMASANSCAIFITKRREVVCRVQYGFGPFVLTTAAML